MDNNAAIVALLCDRQRELEATRSQLQQAAQALQEAEARIDKMPRMVMEEDGVRVYLHPDGKFTSADHAGWRGGSFNTLEEAKAGKENKS